MIKGRTIVITGVSSGFGREMTRVFIKAGANVAGVARRKERLEQLAGELSGPGEFLAIQADVAETSASEKIVSETLARFGGIDALINNAGVMYHQPVLGAVVQDWNDMIDINVKGLMALTSCALPHLIKAAEERGVADIVNVSSAAGRFASPNSSGYCASKFALSGFSESLRQEVHAKFVRVILFEPGLGNTELAYNVKNPQLRQAGIDGRAKIDALEAEDVARCIAFCIDQPRHVSINEMLVRPTQS